MFCYGFAMCLLCFAMCLLCVCYVLLCFDYVLVCFAIFFWGGGGRHGAENGERSPAHLAPAMGRLAVCLPPAVAGRVCLGEGAGGDRAPAGS